MTISGSYARSIGIHDLEKDQEIAELQKVLRAACSALRSYQYGNDSTELAKEIADTCDTILAKGRPQ